MGNEAKQEKKGGLEDKSRVEMDAEKQKRESACNK